MPIEEIFQTMKELVAEQFAVEPAGLTMDTTFEEDLWRSEWFSLACWCLYGCSCPYIRQISPLRMSCIHYHSCIRGLAASGSS